MIEITRFEKVGGPLTKRISLSPDGTLKSDGSACLMARGSAQRVRLDDPLRQGAALIQSLKSHEAIALGRMRSDLPDQVRVITKDRLAALNGTTPPDTIARIGVYISYARGKPAFALVDIDTKGMPPEVRARIKKAGGFLGSSCLRTAHTGDDRAHRLHQSTGPRHHQRPSSRRCAARFERHAHLFARSGRRRRRTLSQDAARTRLARRVRLAPHRRPDSRQRRFSQPSRASPALMSLITSNNATSKPKISVSTSQTSTPWSKRLGVLKKTSKLRPRGGQR